MKKGLPDLKCNTWRVRPQTEKDRSAQFAPHPLILDFDSAATTEIFHPLSRWRPVIAGELWEPTGDERGKAPAEMFHFGEEKRTVFYMDLDWRLFLSEGETFRFDPLNVFDHRLSISGPAASDIGAPVRGRSQGLPLDQFRICRSSRFFVHKGGSRGWVG